MIRVIIGIVTSICFLSSVYAQSTVKGVIKNAEGEALELASVFLVQTSYGAATDSKGQYTLLDVPNGEYLLKVSYLGYKSKEQVINLDGRDQFIDVTLDGSIYDIDSLEISANRAKSDGGFTYENFQSDELKEKNLGQDIPMILGNATNVLSNSDAGAGIGYTDMRIRGSDGTRINVTINGVPWNDSESHGVFFVNLPDLTTDAQSIQIQRGVGTSTNGAGAFGGSVGIETHKTSIKPYASVGGSVGSFGTKKLNVKVGSGLISDLFTVDARFSTLQSDGYVDRAASDLRSYSISVARISDFRSFRFDVFSGAERTYQSWYGAPESLVKGDADGLMAHYQRNKGSLYVNAQDSVNLFSSDRKYNYYTYEDQVDDYGQDHYQFHWDEVISENLTMNSTLFYTYGRGFFEQFRFQENVVDYGLIDLEDLDGNPVDVGNLVRRRWLENDFFGVNLDFAYKQNEQTSFLFGGAANKYIGDHFGEAVFVENTPRFNPSRYYFGEGNKSDVNVYLKGDHKLTDIISVFGDLQYRIVTYRIDGTDNDQQVFDVNNSYSFFNPKMGFKVKMSDNSNMYGSYARANREPVRSDFTDNPVENTPEHETLDNLELGYRYVQDKLSLNANVYYMKYKNQLIPTGALNDVGAALRQNVDDSFREGVEFSFLYKKDETWSLDGNFAVSRNRIGDFTEVIYDYTSGFDVVNVQHGSSDMALSPNLITNGALHYQFNEALKLSLSGQHVGSQFLDNTASSARKIDAYTIAHFKALYDMKAFGIKNIRLNLAVNNLFNTLYSNKGYTYSYIVGDLVTENYLYPQAGIHFILGANVDF